MKRPGVTDHAVVRYLERVVGMDIEALRREIGRRAQPAALAGAASVISEGYRYILITDDLTGDPLVVTVEKPNQGGRVIQSPEARAKAKARAAWDEWQGDDA